MSLKIRLRQQGRTNRQTYRLVVMDIRRPRDGKYLEMLGWYNPFAEGALSSQVEADRVLHWLEKGAQFSPSAEALLERAAPEVVKKHRAHQHAQSVKAAAKRRKLKK